MRAYVSRHHVGLIALMVAVIGLPTAWAIGRNSVGSKELKPNSVKSSEIADDAVKSSEVANGSLGGRDFAAGELPSGPPGPPGSVPAGPPATEVAGPVSVGVGGAAVKLTSVDFTGSAAHRILLTGGFSAICNPCTVSVRPSWVLKLDGGSLVSRRMVQLPEAGDGAGASVGEVIVTPAACQPCTYELWLNPAAASASGNLDVTGIRLGIVDLGPVGT